MQGLLLLTASLGSRSLGALTTPATASQSLSAASLLTAHGLVVRKAARPWLPSGSPPLSTSASALANDLALPRGETAVGLEASTSAPALHLSGARTADPGESRYTAPYWIPEDVRRAHNLPAVLFTDPWHPYDEPELRRQHAWLCLEALRQAGRPLTAEQVREAVNSRQQQQGGRPLLAASSYVSQLLEHMRRTRLVYGKKNPESTLPSGHPAHPRMYIPLPYQAARAGKPEELAAESEAARAKAVQKALKRLKNGKPPYPIHRRRARFSIWQHAQAEEAMRQWTQAA